MILRQLTRGATDEWHQDQDQVSDEHQDGAKVMHPFAEAQPTDRDHDDESDERAVQSRDKEPVRGQPCYAIADRIAKLRSDHQAGARHDYNAEEPEIPRHHEPCEIVKPELCPLI